MSRTCKRYSVPLFPKYKHRSIVSLLKEREIGSSSNVFNRQLVRTTHNPRSNFELLRTLWCDKEAYLETIACRKISRSKAPAFCRGRLFTENYQTWFNLFTGPTSGPALMISNLFKYDDVSQSSTSQISHSREAAPSIKIVDIACIIPPNNCYQLENRKRVGSHIVLLEKSGWLFEAEVHSGDIVSKTYIPTKEYTCNIFHINKDTSKKGFETSDDFPLSNSKFNYNYLITNDDSETLVVKSSRLQSQQLGVISEAFCVFHLYPLRIYCHFVVSVKSQSINPPISSDIVDDLFVVNVTKASNSSFYCFKDVIDEHDIGNNLSIHQEVNALSPIGVRQTRRAIVGDTSLGIPFTMKDVQLNASGHSFKTPCLFKAASTKHCFQIDGPPYHCIVCANRNGTLWALKHVGDDTEVFSGKIQVEMKWDASHWHSLRFLGDEGGRLVHQRPSSLEILSIHHDFTGDSSSASRTDSQCRVMRDFIINFDPVHVDQPDTEWHCPGEVPPMPTHTVTSHGRSIRKPRRWSSRRDHQIGSSDDICHILVSAEFDHELNLFVITHYRPSDDMYARPEWETEEEKSELVVSLFDSYFGKHLSSFVLEKETSPSDRDSISVTLDQDTFIYTRLRPNDNRIQYKILRLNRKYGFG